MPYELSEISSVPFYTISIFTTLSLLEDLTFDSIFILTPLFIPHSIFILTPLFIPLISSLTCNKILVCPRDLFVF